MTPDILKAMVVQDSRAREPEPPRWHALADYEGALSPGQWERLAVTLAQEQTLEAVRKWLH